MEKEYIKYGVFVCKNLAVLWFECHHHHAPPLQDKFLSQPLPPLAGPVRIPLNCFLVHVLLVLRIIWPDQPYSSYFLSPTLKKPETLYIWVSNTTQYCFGRRDLQKSRERNSALALTLAVIDAHLLWNTMQLILIPEWGNEGMQELLCCSVFNPYCVSHGCWFRS